MADRNYRVDIRIDGDGNARVFLRDVEKGLERSERQANSAGAAFSKAGASLGAIGAAAASVAAAGASIASLATEAEKVQRNLLRTNALIEATGATAGFTAEQLHEQARALAFATLQSTEGVEAAQQVLLTFKNVTEDTFTRAIDLAADMSAVFGQDLTSSTTQLGKALEDPVKGITALSRVGVSFSQDQKEMIKSLAETNQLAEAQTIILDVLAGQLGGVAKAEALGLAGAFDTLGQHIQEAKINFAESTGFLDAMTAAVNSAATAVGVLSKALKEDLPAALQIVNRETAGLQQSWSNLANTFNNGSSAIGGINTLLSAMFPVASNAAGAINSLGVAAAGEIEKQKDLNKELDAAIAQFVELDAQYQARQISASNTIQLLWDEEATLKAVAEAAAEKIATTEDAIAAIEREAGIAEARNALYSESINFQIAEAEASGDAAEASRLRGDLLQIEADQAQAAADAAAAHAEQLRIVAEETRNLEDATTEQIAEASAAAEVADLNAQALGFMAGQAQLAADAARDLASGLAESSEQGRELAQEMAEATSATEMFRIATEAGQLPLGEWIEYERERRSLAEEVLEEQEAITDEMADQTDAIADAASEMERLGDASRSVSPPATVSTAGVTEQQLAAEFASGGRASVVPDTSSAGIASGAPGGAGLGGGGGGSGGASLGGGARGSGGSTSGGSLGAATAAAAAKRAAVAAADLAASASLAAEAQDRQSAATETAAAAEDALAAERQRIAEDIAAAELDLIEATQGAEARLAEERRRALEATDPALRAEQERVFAIEDAAAAAIEAAETADRLREQEEALAEARAQSIADLEAGVRDAELALLAVTDPGGAQEAERADILAGLGGDAELIALQQEIFDLEDAAVAAQQAIDDAAEAEERRIAEAEAAAQAEQDLAEHRADLADEVRAAEIALMEASSDTAGALEAIRMDELAAETDDASRDLIQMRHDLEDAAAAAEAAAEAEQELADARADIASQQRGAEIALIEATQGAEAALAAERADILAATDPLLRAEQAQVFATEDLAAAAEEAAAAEQGLADARADFVASLHEIDGADALAEMSALFGSWGLALPPTSEALYDLIQAGVYTTDQIDELVAHQDELAASWEYLSEEAAAVAAETREATEEMLRAASEATIEGLQEQLSAAQDWLGEIESISDSISSATLSLDDQILEATRGPDAVRKAAVSDAYDAASILAGGGQVDPDDLENIIAGVSSVDPVDFATPEEYEAALRESRAALEALDAATAGQMTDSDRQVALLEEQIAAEEAALEEQLDALDDIEAAVYASQLAMSAEAVTPAPVILPPAVLYASGAATDDGQMAQVAMMDKMHRTMTEMRSEMATQGQRFKRLWQIIDTWDGRGMPPDRDGLMQNASYVLEALTIVTTVLPEACVDAAYSAVLQARGFAPSLSRGRPPASYTWALVSGTLPDGLTLASTGVISGTPTTAGAATITASVTAGTSSVSRTFAIRVAAASTVESLLEEIRDCSCASEECQPISGDFETGDLTGWTTDSGTWAVISGDAHTGTYALQSQSASGMIYQTICVPETAAGFDFSIWHKGKADQFAAYNTPFSVFFVFIYSNDDESAAQEIGEANPPDDDFYEYTGAITVPTDTVGHVGEQPVSLRIEITIAAVTNDYPVEIDGEFDDVSVVWN